MQKNLAKLKPSYLDRPLFTAIELNLEKVLYLLFIVVAVVTRFWDLGSRSYNHDESLHALYSWYLYVGRGYRHDPMMHGPFLFHANALIYFLFGDSDYTGRVVPAIFGVALVALPYALRKWLGRAGALATAAMLTISPSFLYFSRFIRHDIFIAGWTMLMVVALFRYLDQERNRYLYLGAAAVALSLSTKEVAYIFGFIGLTFLVLTALWEMARGRERGLLAVVRRIDRRALLLSVGIAVAIFVLLHTTFLTNPWGLGTGTFGALNYWLTQHPVARGGQPWYYYLLLVPLYEFLPVFCALLAIGFHVVSWARGKRGEEDSVSYKLFVPFLLYWLVLAFVIYSWAGEKMPWLTLHLTLPTILVAGHFVGQLVERIDWAAIRRAGGLVLALLVPLTIFILLRLVQVVPFQGLSLQKLDQTAQWLGGIAVLILLLVALYHYWRRLGWRHSVMAILAAFLLILTMLTVRTAWVAAYEHGDIATEMLIYAQGTPDVPRVVRDIEELSRRLTGGLDMKIVVQSTETWPYAWYLRDYPNVSYPASLTAPPDAPVVIGAFEDEAKVRAYMADYVSQKGKLIWWFAEDYKGLTIQRIVDNLRNPATRQSFIQFLLFRKFDVSLGEWPLRKEFLFYVRKDLASLVWSPVELPPTEVEEVVDEYAERYVQVSSVLTWGGEGAEPGQFLNPKGVALDGEGNIYVVDSGNHRIQVFDAKGRFLAQWGSQGEAPGQFQEPWGIAVDDQGHIYVTDTWNHRIQVFDQESKFVTLWGTFGDSGGSAKDQPSLFYGPRDIAVDNEGNLYVTDTGNKRVQKFSPDGEFLGQWGGAGPEDGRFSEPVGIAVSRVSGDIFVADTWNRRIQRFDKSFNYLAQWPVKGWQGESVVNKPYLALDSADNVYVTDPENHRVIKFSPSGELLAVWGRLGVADDAFNLPTGLAIDSADNVYVVDSFNHRVMKFEPVNR
ncbi:MAG: flippase activity-associated protein Agl23 [Anaerolineae bacterium]